MLKKLLTVTLSLLMIVQSLIIVDAKSTNKKIQEYDNIVVFAHFSDDTQESANSYFNSKYSTFKEYFDGSYGRSLKSYLNTISYGQLSLHNYFPQDKNGKITSIGINRTMDEGKKQMIDEDVIESVLKAIPSLSDKVIDINGDGKVDNLSVIVKATGCSDIKDSGVTLVAHKGWYNGNYKYLNKEVRDYNIISTDRLEVSKSSLIIHEFLHNFGYPDLYTNNNTNPVYLYDIMGAVSQRPSWPLAYLRMYYNQWITIDEISETSSSPNNKKTLTLNSQNNPNGNQAFIIKSPLSTTEFFVVEYRQRPSDLLSEDTLDRDLSGSGIIVYRVDTTIENHTNKTDKPGIYIFRPQVGQNGYNSDERICMLNAYLSQESGRTSIGSSDLESTLEDGALTFNDGRNSGIVISNVTSAKDDSISFDVSIPDKKSLDIWQDTSFEDKEDGIWKNVCLAVYDNKKLLVQYANNKICTYINNGITWEKYIDDLPSKYISSPNIQTFNNKVYLSYVDASQNLVVKVMNTYTKTWDNVTKISNCGSDIDMKVINNELYFAYLKSIEGDYINQQLKLGKLVDNKIVDLGNVYKGMLGQVKLSSMNNDIYISVRNASGNKIVLSKYKNNNFENIPTNFSAGTYDIISMNNHLYLALGGSNLSIKEYDGQNWTSSIENSKIDSFEPKLTAVNDNLYVLASPQSGEGNLKMYLYNNKEFIQEGEVIDSTAQNITTCTFDNKLVLAYVRYSGNKIIVKEKPINLNNIKRKNLNKATIINNGFIENKNITVKYGNSVLTENDYDISYNKLEDASIVVTVSAKKDSEKYEGSISKKIINVNSLQIDKIKDYNFTNKYIFPNVVVKNEETKLNKDEDYNLEYDKNNLNAGTASIIIRGKNDYCGSKIINFKINPIDSILSFEKGSITKKLDDKPFINPLKVVGNGKITYSSSDKSVATVDSKGKVTIHKSGKTTIKAVIDKTNNYKTKSASYGLLVDKTCISHKWSVVKKASMTKDGQKKCSRCNKTSTISKIASIKLSNNNYTYNGKEFKPTVVVKDKNGKTIKNYKVSYSKGRKNVGIYNVVITFNGDYSGTKALTYKINPKETSISSLKADKKSFRVTVKKQTLQTTGYEIQYSTSSKFSKFATTTITKNTTTSKIINKLKSKQKYYVRVRTYKTVNKTKLYSKWSSVKTVTTK